MKKFSKVLLVLALALGLAFPATGLAATDVSAKAKGEYLVQFEGNVERGLLKAFGVQDAEVLHTFSLLPVALVELTPQQYNALSNHPKIKAVEANEEVTIAQSIPWGVTRVQATTAHSAGITGAGVRVAVLDTGVDRNHPDLSGRVKGGYSVFTDSANRDPYYDANGHGTHVAGTIAASNNSIGVLGVAYNADIYAVKVLSNSGSGSFAGIAQGIEWSYYNGMHVINMSLGGSTGSSILEQWVNIANNNGIVVVAAAGNSGNAAGTGNNVGYPARYAGAIAVAATNSNNVRGSFSSTGPAVEISAPGVSVLSTVPGGGYASYNGTSMAAPHVAGVAALVKQARPSFNNHTIRAAMNNTALYLGNASHYGNGLVRAWNAINY